MNNESLRSRLLLSVQVALLGMVGPSLRCVQCRLDASQICLRFVFDSKVNDDDRESCEEVATEVISHFPEHELRTEILVAAANEALTFDDGWVLTFLRRER